VIADPDRLSRENAPVQACEHGRARMAVTATRFYAGGCHAHPGRWLHNTLRARHGPSVLLPSVLLIEEFDDGGVDLFWTLEVAKVPGGTDLDKITVRDGFRGLGA
jgi:hypothetical protein